MVCWPISYVLCRPDLFPKRLTFSRRPSQRSLRSDESLSFDLIVYPARVPLGTGRSGIASAGKILSA